MKNTSVFHSLFRTLRGGAALAALAFALAAPSALAGDVALLVGIDKYNQDYISGNDLQGCALDVAHVQAMLLKDPFHDWTVVALTNALATKAEIRGLLHHLATDEAFESDVYEVPAALRDGDKLFYYHSGHGGNMTDPFGKSVCLCAHDADYTDAELAADLQLFRPGVQILSFADTCHSGGLDPLLTTSPRPVLASAVSARLREANVSAANIGFISAAPYDNLSYASPSGSAVTTAFLAAIENGIGNPDVDINLDNHVSAYEAALCVRNDTSLESVAQIFNESLCEQFAFAGYDTVLHHYEIHGPASIVAGRTETYALFAAYGHFEPADYKVEDEEDEAASPDDARIVAHGWTEATLPDARIALRFSLRGYDGDASAVTWELADGDPGSFVLDNTYLWDDATEAGDYEITVSALDADGATIATKTLELTIHPATGPFFEDGREFVVTDLELVRDGITWSVTPGSATADGQVSCPASASGSLTLSVTAPDSSVPVVNSPVELGITDPISPAEALDNALIEWSALPGDADWYGQAGISYDEEDAFQSGLLDAGGSSSFSGSFFGPGLLDFRYLVEGGEDAELVVTADGAEVVRASGALPRWESARILLGQGAHVVTFAYARPAGDPGFGQNRAWIDNVVFAQGSYSADMDGGDQGWTVGGNGVGAGQSAPLWQRGVPSFGPLDGRTCWGTVLDGRYPDEAQGWLVSPEIPVGENAVLAFNTWFDIDNSSWRRFVPATGDEYADGFRTYLDGGLVEVSVQNGAWSNITDSVSVPGNNSVFSIAGSSGGWVAAIGELPEEAAGKTVRIRFRFASDAYSRNVGNPAGWFVDDVSVFSTAPGDLVFRGAIVEDTAQGNNNGFAEPGETVWVAFSVANQGDADRTGVVGSVRCSTPGVALAASPAAVTYGDIPAFSAATGAPRLLVSIDPSVADGTVARFSQTVTDDSGDTFDSEFSFVIRRAVSWSGSVSELAAPGASAPSSGAVVTLSGAAGTFSTVTSAGSFSFAAVPAGPYSLSIAKDGFSPYGPASVTVADGGSATFQIGRAYATPDATSFHFDLAGRGSTLSDVLSLRNAASAPGSVPATVTVSFPDGQPDWLEWNTTAATIPAGSADGSSHAADFRFSVVGASLLADFRTNATVRIVSNDCAGRSVQDIDITLTCAGVTDAADFVSATACTSYDDPAGSADADGYLERGENGYLWFSVRNESDIALSNLVVVSAVAVDGSDPGYAGFTVDTASVRAVVPRVESFGDAFTVPALPVSVPESDVADPWYAIELTLHDPASGRDSVSTNVVALYDRHSVSGTVYSAVRPTHSVTNVLYDRYVFTAADGESVSTNAATLASATPDEGFPVRENPDDIDLADYADFADSSAWDAPVRVTVLASETDTDEEGNETVRVTQVQLDKLVAFLGTRMTNAVLRATTYVAAAGKSLDTNSPPASLLGNSSFTERLVTVEDALRGPLDEATGAYAWIDPADFLADYPALEVVESDDDGNVLSAVYTEFVEWKQVYRTSSRFLVEPLEEAVVYGVGDGELVETVSTTNGTYILHGLRNGYGKVYAVASSATPGLGTGYSDDLVAQGLASTPVVFGSLPDGLPDFTAGQGVDLYLVGFDDQPCLRLADVSVVDANGNGVFEPGESFDISGSVVNAGSAEARTVRIEFSCLFPDGLDADTHPSATFSGESLAYEDAALAPGESVAFELSDNVFGSVEGTATVLVKMTTADANGAESTWWGTFDLVSDGIAFTGTVYLDDEPYGGVRLHFDVLDSAGQTVASQLGESFVPASDDLADLTGQYTFALRGDFARDVRIRVEPAPEFLPQDLELALPGPQGSSRVGLDFHLVSSGASSGSFSLAPQGAAAGDSPALLLSHAEGEATNATLVVSNGTSAPVSFTNVVVRYHRTAAEYGQAPVRRSVRAAAPAEVAESPDDPVDLADAIPGECFVTFRSSLDEAAQEAILAPLGLSVATRYRLVRAVHCRYDASAGFPAVRAALLATGAVLKVEPVRMLRFSPSLFSDSGTPDDRRVDNQWSLLNERQTGGSWAADIDVAPLWARGLTGSRDVIVAVMDTGVDIDHPDLVPNLWVNPGEIPGNGIDDDGNGYVDDVHGWNFASYDNDVDDPAAIEAGGHGSHCAGVIGAVGDNAIGIAGINWRVRILPIRIADDFGSLSASDAHIAEAFDYMVRCGASVVNCSWGSRVLFSSPVVTEAVKTACDSCGLLLVTSAGNEAADNDLYRTSLSGLRGTVDNIIVVAAADHDGKIADFSNFGDETVDIAAPGVDILSCIPRELAAAWAQQGATVYDANYVLMDGTSMASPHVAGAAALLKSISPGSSTADIRKAILEGARRDPNLQGWVATSGHLDVAAAAERLGADWLVPVAGNQGITLAPGETAEISFDVNPDLALRAGTYAATVEVPYALEGSSGSVASFATIPVTNVVSAAPHFVVEDVAIDDSASGDGDGFAEPGETVALVLTVRNAGSRRLSAATGSVSGASSGWPDLPATGSATNAIPLQVAMPAAEGDADFTLELSGSAAGEDVSASVPFTIPVAARGSLAGSVRSAAGAPIPGAIVEFWSDATPADAASGASLAGRVSADASGAYRIDGLLPGAHVALRAIPDGFARSDVAQVDVADGSSATGPDFSVKAPVFWYPGLPADGLEFSLLPGASASAALAVTNITSDAAAWRAVAIERKRVLLLSDSDALEALAPAVESLGFDVAVASDNYEFVNVGYGSLRFANEEHRGISRDVAELLRYDFIVADFDGDRLGGRQLDAAEEAAIRAYLEQGGRLLVTGGSLLASPDNDLLADLLGAGSCRRRPAGSLAPAAFADSASLPEWTLPGSDSASSFAEVADTHPAAAALPASSSDADAFVVDDTAVVLLANAASDASSSPKLLRQTVGNGVVYYWNGSSDAADVAPRGVRQDILRDILYAELLEPATWVSVPASGSFAAKRTSSVAVSVDASTLTAGTHEASILFVGAFADAETAPVRVAATVSQPSLTAFSSLGVTNAFGTFLAGDGQPGSCVFQVIATTKAGGAVSAPRPADGLPADGETVLASAVTGLPYGRFGSSVPNLGLFSDTVSVPASDSPVWIVVRAWNGPAVGGAIWYGDSAPYRLKFSENESHDFGQWAVASVFNYPAADGTDPLDSNGDGIPDGYVLEHFPGMDPAAPLSVDTDAAFLKKLRNSNVTRPYRVFATDRFVYSLNGSGGSGSSSQWGISVWTTNGVYGTLLRTFVPADVKFQDPRGLGLQPGASRFAVADTGNNAVHVFAFDEGAIAAANTAAKFAAAFSHLWTADGADAPGGPLTAPKGVAMDAAGYVYAVDTGTGNAQQGRRILVFNPDGSFNREILPTGDCKLIAPEGIDVTQDGDTIFVANTGAGNIVRLTQTDDPVAYSSTAEIVSTRPILATSAGRVYTNGFETVTNVVPVPVSPVDVKAWSVGDAFRLLVADRSANAVHVLDENGAFVATFANSDDATVSAKDGNFSVPNGVYGIPDSAGIWVADTGNHRLQHLALSLDGDGDGIDDTAEMLAGLDPTAPNDADSDGDGLFDSAELLLGTDPFAPDTDEGGVGDGDEVAAGLDPLDPADDASAVTLTVAALPAEGGSASGAGSYAIGAEATLSATPAEGWRFAGWQDDGSALSPRTVSVAPSGNAYVALFERIPLVVSVQYVTEEGDPSDIVAGGSESFDAYYGLVFHQDRSTLFVPPYAFVSGSDSLGSAYALPVIDFAAGSVVNDVAVTFVVSGGSVAPDEPVPPVVTATSIAVDGDTLLASFTTDAAEESQFGSFMDDARSATVLLVADSLEELSAFRAWRAANPDAPRSGCPAAVHAIPAAVSNASSSAPFAFDISADLSSWAASHDALFLLGFEKP